MKKFGLEFHNVIIKICAILSVLIGLIVIIGWHTKLTFLIQILPAFVPMQYNTALGFLLAGIGLLFIERSRFSLLLGIFIFILGGATLFEYMANINLGIDQLFMHHYILVETSHPGRMAPNTAICFSFVGIALILAAKFKEFRQREDILFLMSALIFILSCIALFGYLLDLPTAYGFGHLTQMALHTSVGLILIGVGLFFYSLKENQRKKRVIQSMLPFVTLFVSAAIIIIVWQVLLNAENTDMTIQVTQAKNYIKEDIDRMINRKIRRINRIAAYWQEQRDNSKKQLTQLKIFFLGLQPYESILWVKENKGIEWIKNKPDPAKSLPLEKSLKAQKTHFILDNKTHIIPDLAVSKNQHYLVIYRILLIDKKQQKVIASISPITSMMNVLMPELIRNNWMLKIYHGGNVIFQSHAKYNPAIKSRWMQKEDVKINGGFWQVEIWPTERFIQLLYSFLPNIIFIIGLLMSALLALIVHLWRGIKKAKEMADQANQAKSQFLSSMSHELRTPLNAAVGYAQLLEYDETLSEQQRDSAKKIRNASKHLLSLINDVLDLSKIEAKKVELSIESVSFDEVMEECFNLSKPSLEKYKVTLKRDRENDKKVFLQTDYFRLKQIMLNLISNAIKYNRENGEVNIIVKKGKSGFWRIDVKDTGRGISKEQLKKMFMPFQRFGAERSNIEGTGIGLVITKDLVTMLKGTIGVDSIEGEGSTFWIELPVGKPQAVKKTITQAALKETLTEKQITARKKILLVEDNPANQAIVVQQLKYLKYEADVASNGKEGYELWKANDYGLVLMDCNMPIMDGYECTKLIRKEELGMEKRIPIIAFTANAYKEELQKCYDAGMDDYLIKPVELESMHEKLERWAQTQTQTQAREEPQIKTEALPKKEDKMGKIETSKESPIDLASLEKYVGKDKDIQQLMIKKFLESAVTIMRDIDAAHTAHSAKDIAFHAHKLKSSAKAVGALQLSNVCLNLEMAGKEEDWQAIDNLTPKVKLLMEDVKFWFKD